MIPGKRLVTCRISRTGGAEAMAGDSMTRTGFVKQEGRAFSARPWIKPVERRSVDRAGRLDRTRRNPLRPEAEAGSEGRPVRRLGAELAVTDALVGDVEDAVHATLELAAL